MKKTIIYLLIGCFLLVGCKKDSYVLATVVRPADTNCANYLLSINGGIYGTYSMPYKDTSVGTSFFLSYTEGGASDSVQCYQSGHHVRYPYLEITKIYE